MLKYEPLIMQPIVMLSLDKFCDLMNQWHFKDLNYLLHKYPFLPFCEERYGAIKKSWTHEGPSKIKNKKIWAHEGPSILKALYI